MVWPNSIAFTRLAIELIHMQFHFPIIIGDRLKTQSVRIMSKCHYVMKWISKWLYIPFIEDRMKRIWNLVKSYHYCVKRLFLALKEIGETYFILHHVYDIFTWFSNIRVQHLVLPGLWQRILIRKISSLFAPWLLLLLNFTPPPLKSSPAF